MKGKAKVVMVIDADGLGSPDLLVIPGSKTTVDDLAWLREQGLDKAISARRAQGTPAIGICGGYQMLGERIIDPEVVESSQGEVNGLGLLPVTTVLGGCEGVHIKGYEIHMGTTDAGGVFSLDRRSGSLVDELDGTIDVEGKIIGTYMHGLFHNREFRRGALGQLAAWKGVELPPVDEVDLDIECDKLGGLIRANVDMDAIYRVVGLAE